MDHTIVVTSFKLGHFQYWIYHISKIYSNMSGYICSELHKLSEVSTNLIINTLRPGKNDDIFKCIFLNENVWISNKISLKFIPKSAINNNPALVQTVAWHRLGDKPLSEAMVVSLLMHICITWPQWVKSTYKFNYQILPGSSKLPPWK